MTSSLKMFRNSCKKNSTYMSPCQPSAANCREQVMRGLEGLATRTRDQIYRHKHRNRSSSYLNPNISNNNNNNNNKYLRNLLLPP